MNRAFWVLVALALVQPAAGAEPPLVDGVSGAPLAWGDWLARSGPAAVLVWASWAPGAADALGNRQVLAEAARERGLAFTVVDVQESLEEARRALAGVDSWVHDRHGELLKSYRVIRLPSLVIVARDGSVLGRLDPSPAALRSWEPR
jgi:hypothetical protein